MGRRAAPVYTDYYTPRPRAERKTEWFPSKRFCVFLLLLAVLAFTVSAVIIPLQQANQAISHGTLKTATITSSVIKDMGWRSSDSQRITFRFVNNDGHTVWGSTSRTKPSSPSERDEWQVGNNLSIHYISDSHYNAGDDPPEPLPVLSVTLSFIIGFLLMPLLLIRSVKVRDGKEKDILDPSPPEPVITFNHETGRSQISEPEYATLPYGTLARVNQTFAYKVFVFMAYIFAIISTHLLSLLATMAHPSPTSYWLTGATAITGGAAVTWLFIRLANRNYRKQLSKDQIKEIDRRHKLLEKHRKGM